MNLDELSSEIRKVSQESVVQELSRHLVEWKDNNETAEELKATIERYIGNSWIEKNEDHETSYKLWSSFRDEAIKGIGGMTMNERLYHFSLFDHFDSCANKEQQLNFYHKLHANP